MRGFGIGVRKWKIIGHNYVAFSCTFAALLLITDKGEIRIIVTNGESRFNGENWC